MCLSQFVNTIFIKLNGKLKSITFSISSTGSNNLFNDVQCSHSFGQPKCLQLCSSVATGIEVEREEEELLLLFLSTSMPVEEERRKRTRVKL